MKTIGTIHKKTCAQVFTAALFAMETIKNPSMGKWPNKYGLLYDRIVLS